MYMYILSHQIPHVDVDPSKEIWIAALTENCKCTLTFQNKEMKMDEVLEYYGCHEDITKDALKDYFERNKGVIPIRKCVLLL
jgi:hypothetical protein